jgi:pyruvate formate lyase activating enzyme
VFFKGCPLRCGWCSNPESQKPGPELILFNNRCITCGQFDTTCPDTWSGWNTVCSSAKLNQDFGARIDQCPVEAVRLVGQVRTAASIMEEVRRDKPFYADGGGITLTGGEPTQQPDFAEALLKLAKAEQISTTIETCGHTPWSVFERLLPYLDTIYFDLKHIDNDIHQRYTGLGNHLILSNLRQLIARDAPVTVRIPLIPGFNASEESMRAIGQFIHEAYCAHSMKAFTQNDSDGPRFMGYEGEVKKELNASIKRLDLLPYHTMGKIKYDALRRPYPWAEHSRLTHEIDDLANILRSFGFTINIGGL